MSDSAAFDLVAIGRSSIDLYSQNVGSPFVEIEGFSAFVGGSPTNIAVGTKRLGVNSALLTAVGVDPVGDFLLNFFAKEGLDTGFVPRKPNANTSAVVLGIEPPDKFPLMFYRDNCADIQLNFDDIDAAPIDRCKTLLITGTGLSKEPSRSATIYAIEKARECGAEIFLDIDFRANQWFDVRAFGVAIRQILPLVDIAIGTEEELRAVFAGSGDVQVRDSQVSSPEIAGNTSPAIERMLVSGLRKALVCKEGAAGAVVFEVGGGEHRAEPFEVEVCNVLGAGDAFASGFIYGYLKGWDYSKCVRMGNAVGAIVVTKEGCANFMPTETETLDFIASHGGF